MARLLAFLPCGLVMVAGCGTNPEASPPMVKARAVRPAMVDKLSLTAPKGWKVIGGEAEPEKMVGPYVDGYQTNINQTAELYDGDLETFENERLQDLLDRYIDCQLLLRQEFTTRDGRKGSKSAIEAVLGGPRRRQNFYVFAMPDGKKYVFTCTVSASQGDEFDKQFDEIMSTYKP